MRTTAIFLSFLLLSFTAIHAEKVDSSSKSCTGACLCEGLILYMPLDGGCIDDKSGKAQKATLHGAIPGKGEFADCFWFDGIDDYIKVADFDFGPQFTVTFWFNSSDNSGTFYQYMFSHGEHHHQHCNNFYFVEDDNEESGGEIKTNVIDENDRDPKTLFNTKKGLSDGTWHLFTASVNDDGTTVYIDGEVIKSADYGGDPIDPKKDLIIGSRHDLFRDRSYLGYLDDIRQYDRALSIEEIQALYKKGR